MKVLLLNGPPRSGKDTIGRILADLIPGSVTAKFATALKRMTHQAFGLWSYPPDFFEHVKDDPVRGPSNGVTWRQAYIAMSEKFVKPLLGERYFGQVLAGELQEEPATLAIITDSGFRPEAEALVKAGHDVRIMHLIRPGTSFKDDSRDYVFLAGQRPPLQYMNHSEDLNYLREKVQLTLLPWVKMWLEAR